MSLGHVVDTAKFPGIAHAGVYVPVPGSQPKGRMDIWQEWNSKKFRIHGPLLLLAQVASDR